MIVRIAGAVIRLYVGKEELPGHLDQGDLIRERSIGVGIRVTLPDGGSYPWEPFNHGLHGVEPLGEHLLQVSNHGRFRLCRSLQCFLVRFQFRFIVFYVVGLGTISIFTR
ncbi:hypothetical protein YC2023_023871 [Brassica napus]